MTEPVKLMAYDRKSAYSYFLAFLQYKIEHDGAKQVDIARAVNVRSEYINRVYKERQGCSVDKQEMIAQHFGMSYLDALTLGKHLRETGELPTKEEPQAEKNTLINGGYKRRSGDKILEADIVAIVSQWVAKNKETEGALAKLQNIIENLSEGLVIFDTELKIEYQNRSHREMFGGSFIGIECNEVHSCEKHICECPGSRAKRTGMPSSAIFPYEKGTASVLTTPIRDWAGSITGYVSVFRDITERQKLMTMSQKAIEMLDRAVLVYDDKLNIKFFNSRLKEIIGAAESDLVTFESFLNYLTENKIFKNYDEIIESIIDAKERRGEANVKVQLKDGKTFLYNAKPMYTHKNMYIGRMVCFIPFDEGNMKESALRYQ